VFDRRKQSHEKCYMKLATVEKLSSLGSWMIFAAIILCLGLAAVVHDAFGVAVVLLVVAWVCLWRIGVKASMKIGQESRRIEQEVLQEMFEKAGLMVPVLRYDRGSSYGYPTFTLVFRTKAEYDRAEAAGYIS